MRKNYEERFGLEAAERVKQITEAEGFFEYLEPIVGGIEAVKAMDQHPRVNVMICTSPLSCYRFVLSEKYAWVEKHLGHEWTKKIVMTKDKTIVSGHILIDDRPSIDGLQEGNTSWEHVLFEQPYNRHVKEKRRLKTWDEKEWRALIDGVVTEEDKRLALLSEQ